MKKLLLCTLPLCFLLSGCTISTETANNIAQGFENLGLSSVAVSLREYVAENAEYTVMTEEADVYSLDASAYAAGTVILSNDSTTKIYSPTVGEIEFNYDDIYRTGNVFYAITGTKNYDGKQKEQMVSVEIDKTDDSAVTIANGSFETISKEYTVVKFAEEDEKGEYTLTICPSDHFDHYWYIFFKEIDGETYYTSIATYGYSEEESLELAQEIFSTRQYP